MRQTASDRQANRQIKGETNKQTETHEHSETGPHKHNHDDKREGGRVGCRQTLSQDTAHSSGLGLTDTVTRHRQ